MDAKENEQKPRLRVVVTGAHSGIGQDLIKRLVEEGATVVGVITPWYKPGALYTSGNRVEYYPLDLRGSLPPEMVECCQDANVLVHLAWVRPNNTFDATADNKLIYGNTRAILPDDIVTVFMSSVCATLDNASNYGQAKFALGQSMPTDRTIEVIAGLVRSEPAFGPYLALQNFVCGLHIRFTFLPSPMALLSSFEQVMEALVHATLNFDTCPRIVSAYDAVPVRLNDLIREILKANMVAALPLPVPTGLALAILYVARRLLPWVAVSDRLITLLTVSPKAVEARLNFVQGIE